VYGVPMLAGRDFAAGDTDASTGVVIVNEAFASRFRGSGGDMIGRVIDGRHVVAVVGNAVYRTSGRVPGMSSLAVREPAAPTLYAPLTQRSSWKQPASDVVRISARARDGDPARLGVDLRGALVNAAAKSTIELRPLMDDVRRSLAQERLSASVSLGFGVLAVLLAVVGLYGVSSYAASLRVAEIGLRIAVGARPGDVIAMMLRRAIFVIAVGIAIGIAAALALSGILASQLFGVSSRDPSTFIAAPAMFAAIALLAALVPALRAARIDPVAALRSKT
jgi:hypothetical protein